MLPVRAYVTSIDYSHTNLGGNDFLLPQSADYSLVKFSGEESRNHIEFTHCHLYGAQSSISFGPSQGFPLFGASSVLEIKRELLPALQVVIKVSTRITEKTAVGALIEGVVDGNVLRKRSVLIPDGSPVRGRVRRLEWNEDHGGYFIVGLEFTDIEAGRHALSLLRRPAGYGSSARPPPIHPDEQAGNLCPAEWRRWDHHIR